MNNASHSPRLRVEIITVDGETQAPIGNYIQLYQARIRKTTRNKFQLIAYPVQHLLNQEHSATLNDKVINRQCEDLLLNKCKKNQ